MKQILNFVKNGDSGHVDMQFLLEFQCDELAVAVPACLKVIEVVVDFVPEDDPVNIIDDFRRKRPESGFYGREQAIGEGVRIAADVICASLERGGEKIAADAGIGSIPRMSVLAFDQGSKMLERHAKLLHDGKDLDEVAPIHSFERLGEREAEADQIGFVDILVE